MVQVNIYYETLDTEVTEDKFKGTWGRGMKHLLIVWLMCY